MLTRDLVLSVQPTGDRFRAMSEQRFMAVAIAVNPASRKIMGCSNPGDYAPTPLKVNNTPATNAAIGRNAKPVGEPQSGDITGSVQTVDNGGMSKTCNPSGTGRCDKKGEPSCITGHQLSLNLQVGPSSSYNCLKK